jgi:hypothetical protein
MKKTFTLQEANKKPERTLEAIKYELRKYIKRERNKKLEDNETMFWDFDCKFGATQDEAKVLIFPEILKELEATLEKKWQSCYIEIIAVAKNKPNREPKE